MIGREATGRFMELLLSTVPRFSTTLVQAYPTSDPDTVIIEFLWRRTDKPGGRVHPALLLADHQQERPRVPHA